MCCSFYFPIKQGWMVLSNFIEKLQIPQSFFFLDCLESKSKIIQHCYKIIKNAELSLIWLKICKVSTKKLNYRNGQEWEINSGAESVFVKIIKSVKFIFLHQFHQDSDRVKEKNIHGEALMTRKFFYQNKSNHCALSDHWAPKRPIWEVILKNARVFSDDWGCPL